MKGIKVPHSISLRKYTVGYYELKSVFVFILINDGGHF